MDPAEFFLAYASTKEILIDVGLSQLPRLATEGTPPAAFQLGLMPVGKGVPQPLARQLLDAAPDPAGSSR